MAHGGWRSEAHERYARFGMNEVLTIPARMCGQRGDGPEQDDREAASPLPTHALRSPPPWRGRSTRLTAMSVRGARRRRRRRGAPH